MHTSIRSLSNVISHPGEDTIPPPAATEQEIAIARSDSNKICYAAHILGPFFTI